MRRRKRWKGKRENAKDKGKREKARRKAELIDVKRPSLVLTHVFGGAITELMCGFETVRANCPHCAARVLFANSLRAAGVRITMTTVRHILAAVSTTAVITAASHQPAFADCALNPNDVEVMFRGRVAAIARPRAIEPWYRVTFHVESMLKGPASERVDLYVGNFAAGLPTFETGLPYTVQATRVNDPRLRQRLGASDADSPLHLAIACSGDLARHLERARTVAPATPAGTTSTSEAPDFVLDLAPRILGRRTPTSSVRAGGLSSSTAQLVNSTLRLTLTELSSSTVSPGNSITFAVLIENTSTETIVLPWTDEVDWHPDDPISDFVATSVGLELRTADGSQHLAWVDGRLLERRKSLPASGQPLVPGQKAVIRVANVFQPNSDELRTLLEQTNGQVEWRPSLVMPGVRAYAANAIKGHVTSRPR